MRDNGIQARFYTQLLFFMLLVVAHTIFVGFAIDLFPQESPNGRNRQPSPFIAAGAMRVSNTCGDAPAFSDRTIVVPVTAGVVACALCAYYFYRELNEMVADDASDKPKSPAPMSASAPARRASLAAAPLSAEVDATAARMPCHARAPRHLPIDAQRHPWRNHDRHGHLDSCAAAQSTRYRLKWPRSSRPGAPGSSTRPCRPARCGDGEARGSVRPGECEACHGAVPRACKRPAPKQGN